MTWSSAVGMCRADALRAGLGGGASGLIQCKGDAAGFKIALELIVNAKRGLRVKEIPIVFRDRERGESKMRFGVLVTYLLRLVGLLARQNGRPPRPLSVAVAAARSRAFRDGELDPGSLDIWESCCGGSPAR